MREQKEQEKQNELLRVVAEQNHERLIEYDVKEDRAVVYAIENDRFEVLFDIEDYVKKNHYGSVFIDPEDKKVFRRAMHACLQKEGTVTVDVRYCEKENQPEWYRFYLVSIAEEDGKTDRMVGRFCCVQQEKAITERMRRRAEIDVLTNVYNHKAFEEYCAKELAECTTNALFVMPPIFPGSFPVIATAGFKAFIIAIFFPLTFAISSTITDVFVHSAFWGINTLPAFRILLKWKNFVSPCVKI